MYNYNKMKSKWEKSTEDFVYKNQKEAKYFNRALEQRVENAREHTT